MRTRRIQRGRPHDRADPDRSERRLVVVQNPDAFDRAERSTAADRRDRNLLKLDDLLHLIRQAHGSSTCSQLLLPLPESRECGIVNALAHSVVGKLNL